MAGHNNSRRGSSSRSRRQPQSRQYSEPTYRAAPSTLSRGRPAPPSISHRHAPARPSISFTHAPARPSIPYPGAPARPSMSYPYVPAGPTAHSMSSLHQSWYPGPAYPHQNGYPGPLYMAPPLGFGYSAPHHGYADSSPGPSRQVPGPVYPEFSGFGYGSQPLGRFESFPPAVSRPDDTSSDSD